MTAYYNEFDPYAAEWLRNLIKAGHIANGVVDERSITDVTAKDLEGFSQHHFFAGIGIWSLAMRQAGWRDEWPAWSGSCPCQPFSSSGRGDADKDDRDLWPAWFDLIQRCRPPVLFGEQVASALTLGKIGKPIRSPSEWAWLDRTQADLETAHYASGAVDLPAAGVGATHGRQRLWFFAFDRLGNSNVVGLEGSREMERSGNTATSENWKKHRNVHDDRVDELADSERKQCERSNPFQNEHIEKKRQRQSTKPSRHNSTNKLADAHRDEQRQGGTNRAESGSGNEPRSVTSRRGEVSDLAQPINPTNLVISGTNYPRRFDSDWLLGVDGNFRAVESGTQPLAPSNPTRVGRLRAYGNSIDAEEAAVFVSAAMSIMLGEDLKCGA